MTSLFILEDHERVEIPLEVQSLSDFRRWALSDEFPERGRIDYIAGHIEVDLNTEDLFCHGAIKVEVVRVLSNRVKQLHLGHLFTDATRISSPRGDFSAEPDVVFVTHSAIDEGDVRLVPKASAEEGRYVELEGPANLIVEIVSDSSVSKDRHRLPPAYFAAGVKEFWLIDGRPRPQLFFQIYRRGATAFEPVAADADGFQPSEVMGLSYRLDRTEPPHGRWMFDLREQ